MNFTETKNKLLAYFDKNNFTENVRNNQKHTSRVRVKKCSNGSEILISFPGYKAYIDIKKNNKTVYDYRVDIIKNDITTALSHTNIIADIFNKIQNGMCPQTLKSILIGLAKNGQINISDIEHKLIYDPALPRPTFIARVKKAHGTKHYNQTGNSFDLTLEELFFSIKWIVLQEDINYPMPKFQGRKMPFARYLETIFVTQNTSHSLEEVITRALSHRRPAPWKEMDYSFLNQIN